jgi:hypothetical protein
MQKRKFNTIHVVCIEDLQFDTSHEFTDLRSKPNAIHRAVLQVLYRVIENKKLIGTWEHVHK